MHHRSNVLWFVSCIAFLLFFPMMYLAGCGGGGGASETAAPTGGTATVKWSPVTTKIDGSPAAIAGYHVYYSETSPVTSSNSTMLDAGNTTAITIGNLTSGHTYYFRVSSYDTDGHESSLSDQEGSKTIP